MIFLMESPVRVCASRETARAANAIVRCMVIHPGQRVPQQQRSRLLDQRLKPGRPGRARVRLQLPRELLLPCMQTSTGYLNQDSKIGLGMRRSDVLDPQHPPTPLIHDLHRRRPRQSSPDAQTNPSGQATDPTTPD
jgi:hypothetical protein